jgi:hypothetical protein
MRKIILFSFLCAFFLHSADGEIIVTEVACNPIGNSTAIPGDLHNLSDIQQWS